MSKASGHNDYSAATSLIKPCDPQTCMRRLDTYCIFCIESDARNGRFEQMIAKLSVLTDEAKQKTIDWIEHCRVETKKEVDNLSKAIYEIVNRMKLLLI